MSVQAAPIGGQVTAGTGNISYSGNTTTINQQSQNLSLNWSKFDITPKETVNFAQPNANAIAVNRVLGSNQASQIQGHLSANGQVWLINPNGVMFGKNSTVNVGGLLTSTLDIADSELNKSKRHFSGSGTGSIINKGNIQTIKGGYVAMIGNTVSNQGRINTPQGTTALAGGSQVIVTFAENQLTGIRVNKSTLNNLVENKQIIQANGGTVIMTAGAHDSLLSSAVNNSGIIKAQTIANHNGTITLLGGMDAGTTTVAGTLDASASHGGKGGSIETSAAHVKIAPELKITTKSSHGTAGTWTIDPQNYTIAASGGDITGSQVSSLLASNNIIISSDQGQTLGTGNLNVNDAISWSNPNSLTLNAVNDVNFSAGTVTNAAGGTLNVRADSLASGTGTIVMGGGSINISGAGGAINFYYNPSVFGIPSTFSNVTAGAGSIFTAYMLVNTPNNLAAIASNATQNYAFGTNLNMSSIANFTPINFSGKLDGQNNTISNLTITGNNNNVGLFSTIGTGAIVKNMTLSGANVSGGSRVGALAGANNGSVSNITASGTVSATGNTVGGVFGTTGAGSTGNCITSSVNVTASGINDVSDNVGGFAGNIVGGTYSNITVTGNVTTGAHNKFIGGFAGRSNSTVSQASYTGTLTTPFGGNIGGFIGQADGSSSITGAFSTAVVTAGDGNGFNSIGGFAGQNLGSIDSSYETGNVSVAAASIGGGFAGYNQGNISNSYATGNLNVTSIPLTGGNAPATLIELFGGFVGQQAGGNLTKIYAMGNVSATGTLAKPVQRIGGLVGFLNGGSLNNSFATGNVTAVGVTINTGGLVGVSTAPASNVYASGNVSASAVAGGSPPTDVGGLFGFLGSTLTNGYSVGRVTTSAGVTSVGGLIGTLGGGTIVGRSFWDTTTSARATSAGGANAVGMTTAQMQTQANFTSATPANGNVNPNWNFSGVWAMGTGSYLYPIFNPPIGPVVTPGPTICPTPAISYYPLNFPNLSASNKVYDGNTSATITGTLSGILPGDTVSNSSLSGTFGTKNVGNNKVVTVIQPTLSGANAPKYRLAPVPITTANITPKMINVTATGVNKVYDANTNATVTLAGNGVIAGDTVAFNNTSANFLDKNVGTNKQVLVSGITASGADSGNYTVTPNTANTTADITPKMITVTATGINKVYDGNTNATVTLASGGVIAGDTVIFNRAANFLDKNVGTNKTVNVTGITASGADGGNYTVTPNTASTTANITPLGITVTATGINKVYDGNTNATVTLASGGVIAGDTVTFSNTAANFDNKNVGTNKPVTVTGISASGVDGGNYTVNTTANTVANITSLGITVTATGMNKVYDGNTNAIVALASGGVIAGDTVTFNNTSANFLDKNVGTNKLINVAGITASGTDGGNYTVTPNTANTTADITPKMITVTATGVNKVYDANTNATVLLAGNGVIAGDTVTFNNTSANFLDKNVGTNKTVNVTGITANGADALNYTVTPNTANTTADITPKMITVTATGVNKMYDGTTAATVTLAGNGVIAGDTVTFNNTSANFIDKNVGTGKQVFVTGISASGVDGGNYAVTPDTAIATANITPKIITVTATGINKVYDGNTNAAVTLASGGVIAGDTVDFTSTANFLDKNMGTNKPVNVSGITASGADGGNYTVNPTTANTTANITPKIITVAATGVDKVYDANTNATVLLAGNGVIAGDAVTFNNTSANFLDKNVGTNKPVNVAGITASGADALNYTVNPTTTSTTADITPLAITVTATGVDKVYDGNTNAIVMLASGGVIAGDTVTFSNTAANFANKNVGTNKPVTVTGISAGGADGGNYTVSPNTASTTANITPLGITVTATGMDKVYDGTTAATVTLSSNGIVPGDSVILNYGSAEFATAGPAFNIPITVTGITAGGGDVANYALLNMSASAEANILPEDYVPPPSMLTTNAVQLQSIAAALQKPLTGCLYNSYDKPLTGCLSRTYKKLRVLVIEGGVSLPSRNYLFT